MSGKEVPYFSILRGVCFLTFFDTSKTQRARPFPLFSREPHAKQDHMAGPQMAISCSLTISVFFPWPSVQEIWCEQVTVTGQCLFVLVISCIEGYKQLTEYYKTKTKTDINQCFVCLFIWVEGWYLLPEVCLFEQCSTYEFTWYFGHRLPWQKPLRCHLIEGQSQTNKSYRK